VLYIDDLIRYHPQQAEVLERLLNNVTELEIQTITSGGAYTYRVNAEVLIWLQAALQTYFTTLYAHSHNSDDPTPPAIDEAETPPQTVSDVDLKQAEIQANYREAIRAQAQDTLVSTNPSSFFTDDNPDISLTDGEWGDTEEIDNGAVASSPSS